MTMFDKIPVILTADQLIDFAIKKTKKIFIVDRDPHYKTKKTVIAKTESFSTIVCTKLESYVKDFPSIEKLHPFYQEIIDIRVDQNKLKKSLGAVDWARKTCQMVYSKQRRALSKTGNLDFLKQKQKEIYGRMSSIVHQVDEHLVALAEAQNMLKTLPDIRDIPTVVIAGYPNVGKSSLLRCLSKAHPQVAQYPFTTKEIFIGHMEYQKKYVKQQIQLIDTPGLLDRPFEERNDIEKQAIAALTHLADLIVFLFDPSETCGYTIQDQHQLVSEMQEFFHNTPVIIVENKKEIKQTKNDVIKISCTTTEGIDELKKEIITQIIKASKGELQ